MCTASNSEMAAEYSGYWGMGIITPVLDLPWPDTSSFRILYKHQTWLMWFWRMLQPSSTNKEITPKYKVIQCSEFSVSLKKWSNDEGRVCVCVSADFSTAPALSSVKAFCCVIAVNMDERRYWVRLQNICNTDRCCSNVWTELFTISLNVHKHKSLKAKGENPCNGNSSHTAFQSVLLTPCLFPPINQVLFIPWCHHWRLWWGRCCSSQKVRPDLSVWCSQQCPDGHNPPPDWHCTSLNQKHTTFSIRQIVLTCNNNEDYYYFLSQCRYFVMQCHVSHVTAVSQGWNNKSFQKCLPCWGLGDTINCHNYPGND